VFFAGYFLNTEPIWDFLVWVFHFPVLKPGLKRAKASSGKPGKVKILFVFS
jgi:hypothetical protein